ncbi:N-formylglutamate amidohydrolase [Ideonella sp. BN130291]|uniref:N-formylglutamate amidohydrolase n=1 Tax=Ideonella sp. BN130291 TaxID=3112940 RepID=UPI002E25B54E|nr:N-formylglutamate amidohydrolase [Ideonella sp. BN130291]
MPTLEPGCAYRILGEAVDAASPIVIDSPHSFRDWPGHGTPTIAPEEALLTSWDAWVDELWAEASAGMAPTLAAGFHRAYIDANRARDDIDPQLLDSAWPEPLRPTPKSRAGMGLIRRLALPGVPLYDRLLSVDDVRSRIAHCYDPYHRALSRLVDAAHARFGLSCHIDCHSMKSIGNAMNEDSGRPRPDIVVSDLGGMSASPLLVRWFASNFGDLGYRVQVNEPYRGAELIRRHGDPSNSRHSVQVEINRALYMDERRFVRNDGYGALASSLATLFGRLVAALAGDLGDQLRDSTRRSRRVMTP